MLGPCLFLIHLLDIADNMSEGTTASSFADDTRVQRGVKTRDDCVELQQDLNNMYEWAETVGMQFNSGKFELLRFWASKEEQPAMQYLAPNGTPIEEKTSLRDLGVRVRNLSTS